MGLATIDIAVIVIYAIFIFGLAQYVSREKAGHAKDSSDYFLASKNLPWRAIGASLIAANILKSVTSVWERLPDVHLAITPQAGDVPAGRIAARGLPAPIFGG